MCYSDAAAHVAGQALCQSVVHYPGELAYLDTFSGLVPCRVVGIYTSGRPIIRLTATRGAYRKGEELIPEIPRNVVPRANVRFHKYGARIVGRYHWAEREAR
jgi:hypothetical protein